MESLLPQLQALKTFFYNNETLGYDFRRQALMNLQKALVANEQLLIQTLYDDLKKSAEEAWVTELGFLHAEIRHTLKHLQQWMKPAKVRTNLLNLPAKSFVYKEPLGVVLIIAPWNYPLQLLFTPLVGAIAAGNCVVLKPSELAPATAAAMRKIIEEAFPKNYILYVEGEGAEIVPAMMNNFRFDHVCYTGSTQVGKSIYEMAAKQLVPVTLELGGKSPCVVEADADIKIAAKRIAVTKFSNAGQMCVAPDFVLVHSTKKDELVKELKSSIQTFYTEDPASCYNYGKIINERSFSRLVAYVKQGRILYGGKYDATTSHIEPTLLDDVSLDASIMNEEIFGPVLPIIPFNSFEEAKAIIDRHPNPLAFYVFTKRSEKKNEWLTKIAFGGGCVNNASWHLTNFNLPFGGRGNSGFGAYHGKYSFETFSHKKAVMKTPTWFDPAIKYPPFKGKLSGSKELSGNIFLHHPIFLHIIT